MQTVTNVTVMCPRCGKPLTRLELHPQDAQRVIGYCSKCNKGRPVIEFNLSPEPEPKFELEAEPESEGAADEGEGEEAD